MKRGFRFAHSEEVWKIYLKTEIRCNNHNCVFGKYQKIATFPAFGKAFTTNDLDLIAYEPCDKGTRHTILRNGV